MQETLTDSVRKREELKAKRTTVPLVFAESYGNSLGFRNQDHRRSGC